MPNFLSEFSTIRWSMLFDFMWPLVLFSVMGFITGIVFGRQRYKD